MDKKDEKVLADYLDLVELDPQWRCFFSDKSVLDLVSDVQKMRQSLDKFSVGFPGEGPRYEQFIQFSKRLNDISQRFFFYKPIGGLRDMFDPSNTFNLSTLRDVLSMRMGSTVASTIRSFAHDPRVSQLLDHFTQYVGSAPDASPAVLCGIAHMQTDEGIWYPMGGTGAVPAALAKLASELGVTIHHSTKVVKIDTRDGRVTGVITDSGTRIECDAVVSNSDAVRTHRELLPQAAAKAFEARRKYEPACSGVVLYLGLKKRYDHLLHHNFVFSNDPHEEFETIYRKGEPARDLTAYVCAPAATEPDVAPAGGEALYILVHTPYLRSHHDWARMLPEYREVILKKLADTAGMGDLRDRIVFERALTPQDIHDRYHVLNGAIYGLASHGRFLGAFKPNNRSPDLKGLYLAGGAAHPGPGMPMVIMSGWIAADALDQDFHEVGPAPARGKPALAQI